jgi:hypothetical protein
VVEIDGQILGHGHHHLFSSWESATSFSSRSKVEAAYGLETVITVITVIDSPPTSTTRTIWRRFGVVANVGIFAGIFPGLSPSLCIVATSKWSKRDRPPGSPPSHRKSSQGPGRLEGEDKEEAAAIAKGRKMDKERQQTNSAALLTWRRIARSQKLLTPFLLLLLVRNKLFCVGCPWDLLLYCCFFFHSGY